jgi:hypothetical protein
MREVLLIIALIVIGLTWLYTQAVRPPVSGWEGFMDYYGQDTTGGLPGVPELASANQAPPLADVMTLQPGLTEYGYGGTAAIDPKREMEIGGQYLQRTNNYVRDYPDNGTAPFNELVGSVYAPKRTINTTVPQWGGQYCLTA